MRAVINDELGPRCTATVGSVLASACNIPVVAFTAILGAVHARHGTSGLLKLWPAGGRERRAGAAMSLG